MGEVPRAPKPGLEEEVYPLFLSPSVPGFTHWSLLQNSRKQRPPLKKIPTFFRALTSNSQAAAPLERLRPKA